MKTRYEGVITLLIDQLMCLLINIPTLRFPDGIYPTFYATDHTRHRGDIEKRRLERLVFIILLSLECLLVD
jgi:hypothetical protein